MRGHARRLATLEPTVIAISATMCPPLYAGYKKSMLETSLIRDEALVTPPSHMLAPRSIELLAKSCMVETVVLSPASRIPAGFEARLVSRMRPCHAPLAMVSIVEEPKSPRNRIHSCRLETKLGKMENGAMNMEDM